MLLTYAGHGGAGALPDDHLVVLPRRAGHHPRVRRREPRVLRRTSQMVFRARDVRLERGRQDHRREQGRQGASSASARPLRRAQFTIVLFIHLAFFLPI